MEDVASRHRSVETLSMLEAYRIDWAVQRDMLASSQLSQWVQEQAPQYPGVLSRAVKATLETYQRSDIVAVLGLRYSREL